MLCQTGQEGQRKSSSLENKPGKLITADKKKVEGLNNIFASIFTRNIQGQLGENSEQTELVKNVPAHYWALVPAEL